ncbi:hypothetical protein [Methylobacterium oxalidis]|uniref:PIN domain-containing protein n=1 Tax=Methylobacterium oxalidis TaxID=944322 RepID=A0A512J3K3_9HYPH|nr:hypothetical protein [Methylobacterium oxalidis]GEP04534.1 hypothetical protein MOX02_25720 [Methylobacterium oxalidis]GJE35547.1 tRNA(fMet)-specific endonuclease VapC [Methylobacterium oxalidis]GLS64813.1 hypothetical protein GCM10007888_31940 [Methylobacterium oxalidis]
MRYLLDTTIISNLVKASPSEPLVAWMAGRNDEDLHIASLTVAEIRRGILEKPAGRRRGRPRGALDTIIAALAQANDCVVVTDDETDFGGVRVVNPLRGAP